jgi:sporulation protein YlmC with PRC-barrel domain
MRLSDLRDKKIRAADGALLGRVHEVHCERGRVVALMCGSVSLIERWTAHKHGLKIPWERVRTVDEDQITLAPDAPKKIPRASRSRKGTRRPSGPPPKR